VYLHFLPGSYCIGAASQHSKTHEVRERLRYARVSRVFA
jgi:hypothetical protein